MSASRVLLLSAHEIAPRADTDLGEVVSALLAGLSAHPGCEVVHHEVSRLADVERAVRTFRPDVVFNACETFYGQSRNEPAVPILLEKLDVAFTGSPAQTLRLCLLKSQATAQLRTAGVSVPASQRFDATTCDIRLDGRLSYPVIVKPEREDGSVGIDDGSVVEDDASLRRAVLAILEGLGQPALVQSYIAGREIAVALLGYPAPRALPPGEIAFDRAIFGGRAQILTYASKWDETSHDYGASRSIGAAASPAVLSRVAACARRAFDAVGMRDYGRVDMRLDASGRPFVIDVNPNCDLSTGGGFMKAAARAGMSYTDAVGVVLRGALTRAIDARGAR
ncbi:MAG: D-alanine--D-alanine ligase [Labilithrix sp.]|nr:D-alanine--D-alanine ligase [Labilithrix sp.]